MNKFILIFILTILSSVHSFTQEKELSWEALSESYHYSEWYTQARFGIWSVWGPQSQEGGGGWYARYMYKQYNRPKWATNVYPFHLETYGHPSEFGYKDVINEWKAEKFDADSLMKYFKSLGAKYFMVLANHHDHYDLWNSTHHEWNSVNVGPKRDIVGEWEKAARKYGLPFAVTVHDDRFLHWWKDAFQADTTGDKKGVPYDGYLTKADGKGKWWEGLDPANLYGLPPEQRTPEYIKSVKEGFLIRHTELITKYNPDMLWFDGYGFPYNEYGKELSRRFFANSLRQHGEIKVVVAGKFHDKQPAIVEDIERGGSNEIKHRPWQSITNLSSWYYNGGPFQHSARSMIEMMSDVFSKNGNLVLNVELKLDGTIPAHHKPLLDDIGEWVNINSEAIYGSKPWKIYGDNLDSKSFSEDKLLGKAEETDLEHYKKVAAKNEQFNERKKDSEPYAPDVVRFTTKGDALYVFVLNPKEGKISIPSLGLKSKQKPGKIKSISIIGSKRKIEFKQDSEKLTLFVPSERPNEYTVVFKLDGVL